MIPATLLSIQISSVADVADLGSNMWWDKSCTTAFCKPPVEGRIWLG